MTLKDPFWRGLSGTNSGGRFAPGRFYSLFHQTFHKHTSAGLAAISISVLATSALVVAGVPAPPVRRRRAPTAS